MSKLNNLEPLPKNSVIGIFGGGQLGRMTCVAAHKMGYKTLIFSDVENSPASFVTENIIVANYQDKDALRNFAAQIDIATLEFENIPVAAVEEVSKIKPVYPNANNLRITQDRLHEKGFLTQSNVNVTNYCQINSLNDLELGLKEFENDAILKTATLGYDGKGQFRLNEKSNLTEIWNLNSDRKMILEKIVPFEQEISVIAARSVNNEVKCFPPLTNIHKNSILDRSIYPAKVSDVTSKKAQEIAIKIIQNLDLIGLVTVEFFVLPNGDLLVNELAPRPHNSGHFSMDACETSQFEQLVRAISGTKLGSTKFHSTGHMQNLIGNDVSDLTPYSENQKAKIHLYDKKEIKEGRKMGHVNILA